MGRAQAVGLDIYGIVADPQPTAGGERPGDVDATRQNTQHEGVARADVYQLIVGEYGGIEENKESVFRCFWGRNVPAQATNCSSEFGIPTPEPPPELLSGGFAVHVAFRFYGSQYVLVYRWESRSHFFDFEGVEVDYH